MQRLGRLQHLLGVARHLDAAPLPGEPTLGVDQEGAALYPQMLLAVHLLELDDVEDPAHRFVLVGDQLEVEGLLGLEVLLGADAVPGDAEDHGVGGLEVRLAVTEVAPLGGAPRSSGLWEEVDHHLPALEPGEGYGGIAAGGG